MKEYCDNLNSGGMLKKLSMGRTGRTQAAEKLGFQQPARQNPIKVNYRRSFLRKERCADAMAGPSSGTLSSDNRRIS